jgi:hypothetical protein
MALVAIFSFIFGHLFVGCNWFAVLWNLSVQGSMLYGVALAPAIFLSAVLGSDCYDITRLHLHITWSAIIFCWGLPNSYQLLLVTSSIKL